MLIAAHLAKRPDGQWEWVVIAQGGWMTSAEWFGEARSPTEAHAAAHGIVAELAARRVPAGGIAVWQASQAAA